MTARRARKTELGGVRFVENPASFEGEDGAVAASVKKFRADRALETFETAGNRCLGCGELVRRAVETSCARNCKEDAKIVPIDGLLSARVLLRIS